MTPDETITGLMDTIQLQGDLLDDAGDIFEQINMRGIWERRLDARLGRARVVSGVNVYDGTPHEVAHQREAHGTLKTH